MPKQLNIRLGFEADTSKAKQQIADLQKSLDGLLKTSMGDKFTGDIEKAQTSILKLKNVLNNSLNFNTGGLDLTKFTLQLEQSGLTAKDMAMQFSKLGPEVNHAFLQIANSVVTAQKPIKETNKLIDNM